MRAARLHTYGPPSHLVVEEVPDPILERPTDVRLRVTAAAINPIDWKIRAGKQRGAIRLRLPWVLGLDVAGEVLEVGASVTDLAVGDRVYGCPDWRRPGSYAEQVVMDASLLAPAPTTVSDVEAAALPLAGLTAWQCLLPRLADKPDQRVFIQAGSGGVGHLAIQLAKHHGAWVATTASPRNHDYLRALGADRCVDYRTERWWEVLDDLDVILDALGYDERERALAAVRRGGRVASIVSGLPGHTERYGPNLGVLATGLGIAGFAVRGCLRGVDAATVVKRTHKEQLVEMAALVDQGVLRPTIDTTYPLEGLPEAHAQGEAGHIRGKVVIDLSA